jgi:hypothetical protein
MIGRRLVVLPSARTDIARHAKLLRRKRGEAFAAAWTIELFAWLGRQAEHGAQIGTEHPRRPGYRTFGYRRQATILARFALVIARVYPKGRDWSQ